MVEGRGGIVVRDGTRLSAGVIDGFLKGFEPLQGLPWLLLQPLASEGRRCFRCSRGGEAAELLR